MFPIKRIPEAAPHSNEQLGTKPKFWFRDKGASWLFKERRPSTGEAWSEKVASELCVLLGLPHADYELAEWKEKRGVATRSLVPDGGRLVLGNELLSAMHREEYDEKARFYRSSQHTLARVMKTIGFLGIAPPIGFDRFEGVETATDVFVGYLMLDAWIANQDRHHENWGLILSPQGTVHLCPTYDHASSLGMNETDESREDRLTTNDRGRSIDRYVERARSAFFESSDSKKAMPTLDAFGRAAVRRPRAAKGWLERLRRVSRTETESLFAEVPPDWISPSAVRFALKMLELNSRRLLELETGL